MVKGNVFLKDHHQMLDRGRGFDAVEIIAILIVIFGNRAGAAEQ